MLGKFKCLYCNKWTLYRGHKFTDQNGKVVNRLCKPCSVESDAEWKEFDQQRRAAEEAAYLASRCKQLGCWEEAVKDGYCQSDWDYNFLCDCGKLLSECGGACISDVSDDPSDDSYEEQDEECPGGCGQPAYACTCAELASLRRYNATPLEERCGPWTA